MIFVYVALLLQALPFFPPWQVRKPYRHALPAHIDDFHDTCTLLVRSGSPFLFAQGLNPMHPSVYCFFALPCISAAFSASLAQCDLVFVPYVAAMLNSGLTLEWMCCWRSLSLGWQPLRVYDTVKFPLLIFAVLCMLSAFFPTRRHADAEPFVRDDTHSTHIHPTCLALVHLHDSSLLCVYPMILSMLSCC